MHKIGDNVMYGANGVMTIVDIREESVGDISRRYYVLRPVVSGYSDSLTFVPADNERLVGAMHPLLTPDGVQALISFMKEPKSFNWVRETRPRSEYFKRIMESGDRELMVAMIQAIDENAKRREAEGKKNFISDENAKHKALKLLSSEISVVLGISESDAMLLLNNE